jgi:hypothetical protein
VSRARAPESRAIDPDYLKTVRLLIWAMRRFQEAAREKQTPSLPSFRFTEADITPIGALDDLTIQRLVTGGDAFALDILTVLVEACVNHIGTAPTMFQLRCACIETGWPWRPMPLGYFGTVKPMAKGGSA